VEEIRELGPLNWPTTLTSGNGASVTLENLEEVPA
jgi:hypothetical protein